MRRKRVIRPVPTRYLLAELTPEKMLGGTNHAGNLIYVVDAADSPAVLTEIGRLREISFRDAGGGTGESLDLDEGDLAHDGYRQMIVWNPYERQIVGGYRFIISDGCWPKHLSTEHYFRFSEPFRQRYLPHTIELGRSFIQPRYQSGRGGVFSLDNLWDGMGAVVSRTPHAHYLFGKVTLYPSYEKEASIMNEKVYVTSMVGGLVKCMRKTWPRKGTKLPIEKDLLREAIYEPGVEFMFKNGILYIDDMDFKIELGLEEEGTKTPTNIIALDEKYMNRIMRLMPIAEMRNAVVKLADNQKRELIDYASEQNDVSMDRLGILKELTGIDVLKVIELKKQKEE